MSVEPVECTDRIEKAIVLRASRSRVWRALTDSGEFGAWFGARFDGPFLPGATVSGSIVPTTVNPTVAEMQKQYEGTSFEVVIDRVEPERLFSFRWHPFGVDSDADLANEPMTLVAFTLEDVTEGVRLTVTESGFDQIPIERRARAFSANEGGWEMVVTMIEEHLGRAAHGG